MKKTVVTILILALTLALSQIALAEPSEALQTVYDAMIAADSEFSKTQALYAEYYEGVTLEAALADDGITFTLNSDNEYVESGAWTFALDGDNLVATVDDADFYGYGFAINLLNAAVTAQGVNTSLFNGYLGGLTLAGQEDNPYFTIVPAENEGKSKISVNIVGPYEMEGLDDMVLTEDVLAEQEYAPLSEEGTSSAINFGKISMIVNGNADSATFLVMEYGALDDLALQAITAAVKTLQPAGWEDFIANYTALEDAQTDAYTVTVNADEAAVGEIIDDANADYSAMIVTFG